MQANINLLRLSCPQILLFTQFDDLYHIICSTVIYDASLVSFFLVCLFNSRTILLVRFMNFQVLLNLWNIVHTVNFKVAFGFMAFYPLKIEVSLCLIVIIVLESRQWFLENILFVCRGIFINDL